MEPVSSYVVNFINPKNWDAPPRETLIRTLDQWWKREEKFFLPVGFKPQTTGLQANGQPLCHNYCATTAAFGSQSKLPCTCNYEFSRSTDSWRRTRKTLNSNSGELEPGSFWFHTAMLYSIDPPCGNLWSRNIFSGLWMFKVPENVSALRKP